MAQKESNPLQSFFRSPEAYVSLPSRGYFYPKGTLEVEEGEYELGILPMTAQDEMMLKNPDALLSGEAISYVIKSCVPQVNVVDRLLECDIEVIMLGIRKASFAENATIGVYCPECDAENHYDINLDVVINKAQTLEAEYNTIVQGEITVYVKPNNFKALVKQYQSLYEAGKIQRLLQTSTTNDDQRLSLLSNGIKKMSKINFELLVDSIDKIVYTNAEDELVEVSNRKHISEFLQNVKSSEIDKIDQLRMEIAKTGIAKTAPVTCTTCQHEWDAPLEFNPMSFSSAF
jgi:hypothetical protein